MPLPKSHRCRRCTAAAVPADSVSAQPFRRRSVHAGLARSARRAQVPIRVGPRARRATAKTSVLEDVGEVDVWVSPPAGEVGGVLRAVESEAACCALRRGLLTQALADWLGGACQLP